MKKIRATYIQLLGKEKGELIFGVLLEWDHDDPLQKTEDVCQIFNTVKRLLEIKKCTLRCTF